MDSLLTGIPAAMGLGALIVIHPCPASTNIAAVSFLLSWREKSGNRIVPALLFVVGEIMAYSALGIFIASGLLHVPTIARFLQAYMVQLLGPVLILMGMMLSGLLLPHQSALNLRERIHGRSTKVSLWGSLLMGILIALSFCPMSAAIFFGVLVPLAVANDAVVLYPALFGIGASLPLLVMVVLTSRGAAFLSRLSFAERATGKKFSTFLGAVLIILGVWMSLQYIFEIG